MARFCAAWCSTCSTAGRRRRRRAAGSRRSASGSIRWSTASSPSRSNRLGAVAEPYALWAIEDQPGLELPCRHAAIVVASDLKPYERLKLFILNLGHTYLAEIWAQRGGAPALTVREAMADAAVPRRSSMRSIGEEVLPVFAAIGMGNEAQRLSRDGDRAILQSVSRSPPVRNLHQPRGQEAAPLRRPDRTRQGERRRGSGSRASRPRSPTAASMTRDPLAAGDLIAERRFAYAKAAAEEGDLERGGGAVRAGARARAPLGGGGFALGETREKLGDLDAAAQAFRQSLVGRSRRRARREARLALIGRGRRAPCPAASLCRAAVRRLCAALRRHLTENLGYRGPALIAEALERGGAGPPIRARPSTLAAVTGLMGEALRGQVDRLTGVDLSPAMIAKAREREIYDRLVVGDAAALLACEPPGVSRPHRRG